MSQVSDVNLANQAFGSFRSELNDILGALNIGMLTVIMSFLFVNLFDTTGTLLGVATRANLVKLFFI